MKSYHRNFFALLVFFLIGLKAFGQTEKPLTDWERKEYKKDLEQNKKDREKYGRGLTDRQLVDWMERMRKEGEESDRWWEKYYAEIEKECVGAFPPDRFKSWEHFNAEMCGAIRGQMESIRRPRLSYVEDILIEFAGVDIDNSTPQELKEKMTVFWEKYYKCLECTDVNPPFPRGNYLKQLAASALYTRQFGKFLRTYQFPPNIIDESDGYTVLDYVFIQTRITPLSSTSIIEHLNESRKLLLREGAKYVHELKGEKIKDGPYLEYFTYRELKPEYYNKDVPDEVKFNYTEILYEKGQYKNGKRFGEWTFYHPLEKNKYFVLSYDDNGEVIRSSIKDYK